MLYSCTHGTCGRQRVILTEFTILQQQTADRKELLWHDTRLKVYDTVLNDVRNVLINNYHVFVKFILILILLFSAWLARLLLLICMYNIGHKIFSQPINKCHVSKKNQISIPSRFVIYHEKLASDYKKNLANAKESTRQRCVLWRPLAKKSTANRRKEHDAEKYIQWVTTLTKRLCRHSFSCCCVPNRPNPAKSSENSNLYSSRLSNVIDLGVNRKRVCNLLLVVINTGWAKLSDTTLHFCL